MRTVVTILFACFIFNFTADAQQTPDFSTVKTEKGMMVIHNSKAQPFSFLVPGKDPNGRQNDDGSLLIGTGSGAIFVYFVKTSNFLDKKKIYTEAETLAAHRDSDIATQEKAWKTKLKDLEKGESFVKVFNLTNNLSPTKLAPTVNWIFTVPKPGNTDRTLHQTVLLGDTVLMLGAVFPTSVNPGEVRAFFTKILESITLLLPQKPTAIPIKVQVKRKVRK